MKLLIPILIGLMVLGCSRAKKHVAGALSPESTLKGVELSYLSSDDLARGEKAFVLKISNQSTNKLENCVVTIDEEYKAPLSHSPKLGGRVQRMT